MLGRIRGFFETMGNLAKAKFKQEQINANKFLQAYIETGNATQAYLKVHPNVTYESATVLGSRELGKVSIPDLLENMGLSRRALTNVIAIGLSKPTKNVKKWITIEKDGKQVKALRDVEVPDYAVRHKYVETALKLQKMLGNEPNINIDADDIIFLWGNNEKPEPPIKLEETPKTQEIIDKT